MNLPIDRRILRNLTVLLLTMAVPVFAQHKTSNSSAPAPKAAPASHASAPAQHSTTPSHGPTNTNAAHGPSNMGHGPTNTNTAHGSTNTNATHGTTNANTGHGPTNATTGHGTTNANNGHGATNNANTGHGPNANVSRANPSRTPPGKQVSLKGGGTASIRPNGQVRSINRNGMQIQHGLHGGRTVVSTHNGARVVTTGAHGGYVQRNYVVRNGNTYVSRTYVVNNVSYTSVYRSYGYGGYCCYYGYAPAYYYHPVYYGWAYNPWPAPVYYGWGWGGAPWYGYYGAYYEPYPVYPAAYFWLTDWMIAASLQAAYSAQIEANAALSPLAPDLELVASLGPIPAPDDSKVAMTKEVKDQLAEEVKAQLAEDQSAAGKSGNSSGGGAQASGGNSGGGKESGPPPALDPKRHIFVVNDEVTSTVDGQECSLTAGDIITRVSDTPDDDRNVDVKVLASKKTDCVVGKTLSVAVDDLEEMHNHFREQITGGMEELSKKNGSGGLPKAPDTGKQDGEVPAPPPDNSAAKTLKDQQSAADSTEADVKKEAGSSSGGSH